MSKLIAQITFIATLVFCIQAGAAIGDPARPGDLPNDLALAHQAGQTEISITPGVYELPSTGHDTLLLDHWKNTHIHASGVTLIFDEVKQNPIRFNQCDQVTLEGALLRLKTAPNTQGKIIQLGSDARGYWCDWVIDVGYPTGINPVKSTFNVVDAQSRVLKTGAGDVGVSSFETSSPNRYRLHFQGHPVCATGDWLVTRAPGGGVICHLDNSTHCTLQDITCQNGGFGTYFETSGGANHLIRCNIDYGPPPAGATEKPVVSCGADGLHSVDASTGPDIEDCRFNGVFLDDCMAIHGTFQKVVGYESHVLTLVKAGGRYAQGDPVCVCNGEGYFAESTCQAVREVPGPDHFTELTCQLPTPVPTGCRADNPARCGRGYKIVRCTLGNTRSRGILVKGNEGLIDGCTIEGCGMSAISVGPEFYWNEAGYCRGVTISRNLIRNCDKRNGSDGVLWVHGEGAMGNQQIVIRDNQFDQNYGQYQLKLEWLDGGTLAGNQFTRLGSMKAAGEIIHLNHTRTIKLDGNVAMKAGLGADIKLIGKANDVSQTVNEGPDGICEK